MGSSLSLRTVPHLKKANPYSTAGGMFLGCRPVPQKWRIWAVRICLVCMCLAAASLHIYLYKRHEATYIIHSIIPSVPFIFEESRLAHALLDGLSGVEIGASAQNPFGLQTINVDFTNSSEVIFKRKEQGLANRVVNVDVVTEGDHLPFDVNSWDFVISSHVIEHFYDPIAAIEEWLRVVKPGGLLYIVVPHKARTPDLERVTTTVAELVTRHRSPQPELVGDAKRTHHSFWTREAFLELCRHQGWRVIASQDVDDKVGNGFTVVLQKPYC